MAVTARDIVNQAVQLYGGNQPPVTGNAPTFDNSATGKAAAAVYAPTVATVARQFEWDFARRTDALIPTGRAAPFPWTQEYRYPLTAVQIWQVLPASADPNDPQPTNWVVANVLIDNVQTKVIHSDLPNASAVYNANPSEDLWDPLFREAVVRLLASNLAMAIAAKPDTAAALLESANGFAMAGQDRDES